MYVFIHAYININVYICMHVFVCMYIYMHTYLYMYACTHTHTYTVPTEIRWGAGPEVEAGARERGIAIKAVNPAAIEVRQ